MKNYANRFPLPTGNIWVRLPERVTAQETKSVALEARVAAIEKNPLVYKTIFSQANTSAPAPVAAGVSKNTTNSTITFGYTGVGTYTITSALPIFTAGKTHVIFGAGANKFSATAVVTSTTVLTITSTSIAATPALANDLFSNTPISIEIFN